MNNHILCLYQYYFRNLILTNRACIYQIEVYLRDGNLIDYITVLNEKDEHDYLLLLAGKKSYFQRPG